MRRGSACHGACRFTALTRGVEWSTLRLQLHHTVFVLPPWPEIYVNDAERDQSFAQAASVHGQIQQWYARCGYQINEVPCVEVEQRVSHVLEALGVQVWVSWAPMDD
jgi:predicted ATPase